MAKAVIFDMDGVLFATEEMVIVCWEKIAEKYHIENVREACYECLGTTKQMTEELFLRRYGEHFSYEEYKGEVRELFQNWWKTEGMPVKKGVYELMDWLKGNGFRIALATSTRRESALPELESCGLDQYLDVMIFGDMVTKSKPDPEIYLLAAEKLGVEPSECFAIEDSYNGVRSAARGGLRTIMVPDLLPSVPETDELSEVVLADLNQVLDYIQKNG